MKIIISPAKKMNVDTDSLAVTALPVFLEQTRILCRSVQEMTFEEAKDLWGCNEKLARLNYRRFQEMDLEGNLTPAVLSYEGLQYQHMAPGVFTWEALSYMDQHLRILSGFYGILRPFDGVTPYRLEMQAKLSPDAKETPAGAGGSSAENKKYLYGFWGRKLYEELMKENENRTILNLASREYSLAVEPYLTPDDRFVSCVFGELQGKKIRQKATLAKMARGEMVRFMAEGQITDLEKLRYFKGLGFCYAEEFSTERELVFLI